MPLSAAEAGNDVLAQASDSLNGVGMERDDVKTNRTLFALDAAELESFVAPNEAHVLLRGVISWQEAHINPVIACCLR